MNSIKLNKDQMKKLLELLGKKGIDSKTYSGNVEYERLRYKIDDKTLIIYNSGSVVWNSHPFIDKLIDLVIKKSKDLYSSYDLIVGSDEVGKGEWYGPLITVAACVKIDDLSKLQKLGVKDSKKLTREQIFRIFNDTKKVDFNRTSVKLNASQLKELWKNFTKENKNYNDLIAWTHQRVIEDLLKKINQTQKVLIIIDKFDVKKVESRLKRLYNKDNIKIIQIAKGESEIPVALASIIAKKIWYEEIDNINRIYSINLPKLRLEEIQPKIVSQIGKLFFKNVRKVANDFLLRKNLNKLTNELNLQTEIVVKEDFKRILQDTFKNNKTITSYIEAAINYNPLKFESENNVNNSLDFLKIIEKAIKYQNEIIKLKKFDPDFDLKVFIIYQLNQMIDETDLIDFKFCLKNKDRIAKTISAFCNAFILSETKSYIVFGVMDRKDLPKKFELLDRIINLDEMLKASKIKDINGFQFAINSLCEKHLDPSPDSCFTIKSLNLEGYSPFDSENQIILIEIHSFNLNQPIYFQKQIFIRKNGQDKQASDKEIEMLIKKLNSKN